MRVHIEIEKFSNLKFSFIFSDKEDGSIPASAPFKIKGLRAKADANPCLFPAHYFQVLKDSPFLAATQVCAKQHPNAGITLEKFILLQKADITPEMEKTINDGGSKSHVRQ